MAQLSDTLSATVRRERGRIIAGLLRVCRDLDAAEDALHDAVVAAMHAWHDEVPVNPGAWLTTAARRRALDTERRRRSEVTAVAALSATPADDPVDPDDSVDAIADDTLRLLFLCCDPELPRDGQVALTLKLVAGLSTAEIARAFVTTEETVSQRILRAKKALAGRVERLEPAHGEARAARVDAVLDVVYAVFAEGHTASSGPLMRLDLQSEALRLGQLVCDLAPELPQAFALLALMCFGAARSPARVDAEGAPILLADQDRALWSRPLLREAFVALECARAFGRQSGFGLQAEIAAAHAVAASWASTDWVAIVGFYDALVELDPSPVAAMNRAIALSMRDGPRAGLAALDALRGELARYHLFYAARAEMLGRDGLDARDDVRSALALTTNDAERSLLRRRLEVLERRAARQ